MTRARPLTSVLCCLGLAAAVGCARDAREAEEPTTRAAEAPPAPPVDSQTEQVPMTGTTSKHGTGQGAGVGAGKAGSASGDKDARPGEAPE